MKSLCFSTIFVSKRRVIAFLTCYFSYTNRCMQLKKTYINVYKKKVEPRGVKSNYFGKDLVKINSKAF